MIPIRTGRCRCDQRFMISENLFIVQIEIIIADLLPCRAVLSKRIVKGCIQMIVGLSDFYDIPSMTIFNFLFWIGLGNYDDSPDPEGIAQNYD